MRQPHRSARTDPIAQDVIYTCPMHPQIRQIGPGHCHLCGMALEPETIAPGAGPNPELADMTWRFWIGLLLTIPVLVLAMGSHLPGLEGVARARWNAWAQLLLSAPVVLWSGWSFLVRGIDSLRHRNLNMSR